MLEETERDTIANTVREEFNKILEKKDPDLVSKEPSPLMLTINGQQYKFKDQMELESALGQTFTTFNTELANREAKLREAPPAKEGGYVSGKEAETGFNQEEYIGLMGKDILKANDYLLNHQIFGGKVPNASAALRQKLGEVEKQNATLAVYQFKELHPEFPLTEQATKIVDGLRRELGQDFSLGGLEAAYGVAQSRGLLPSPQVAAYQKHLMEQGILKRPGQQEGEPVQQDLPLGFAPPPSVSRASQSTTGMDLANQAENMNLTELTQALRRAGML